MKTTVTSTIIHIIYIVFGVMFTNLAIEHGGAHFVGGVNHPIDPLIVG